MKRRNGFWGIFFIAAAVLIIVNQLGYLGDINFITLGFTIILIPIIVKSIMYFQFGGIFFPLAFLGILYDERLGIENMTPWPILLTALFLTIGCSIMFHKKMRWGSYEKYVHVNHHEHFEQVINDEDPDVVNLKVSFSSAVKYVNTESLQRANLFCSFGAMKVYFDNAKVHPDGAQIHLDISFGALELYIPKTWRVENNANVSLAGFEEKHTRRDAEIEATVKLTGNVSFSGVQIFYL